MATHAEAISAAGQSLDKEFDTLVNLMQDIADGDINGSNGDPGHLDTQYNAGRADEWYGYKIGGQEIVTGHQTRNGWVNDDVNASKPGTMLQISTATSTQAVFTGQLTDTSMKATQLQKAVSQKIG